MMVTVSCIDTELPVVPENEQVHIFVESKPKHLQIPAQAKQFAKYPDVSSLMWHQQKQKQLNGQN